MDVSQDADASDGWPEDHLLLQLLYPGHPDQLIAKRRFESSYGYFDLAFVDLTGDQIEELVLVTGAGRGTNGRSETLRVLQRNGRSFRELLSTDVSGPCGVTCFWEYTREFVDVNGDGVPDIKLTRRIIGYVKPEDHALIPKQTEKAFVYDAKSVSLIPFKTGE